MSKHVANLILLACFSSSFIVQGEEKHESLKKNESSSPKKTPTSPTLSQSKTPRVDKYLEKIKHIGDYFRLLHLSFLLLFLHPLLCLIMTLQA